MVPQIHQPVEEAPEEGTPQGTPQDMGNASHAAVKAHSISWPEQRQAWFNPGLEFQKWTYSYMNMLLRKGSKQKLEGSSLCQEDLFTVPPSMKSGFLASEFK
jgi:hypothetical protein